MKQIARLRFWFHKSCSKLNIFMMEHFPHRQENADLETSEFEDANCSEELKEFSKMVEEEYEDRINSEPVLDPQTTMLFASGHHRRRCNFLTARRYRTYIRLSYRWAREQGITTFIIDYTTPFGLLAMETLLELRSAGADFVLYAISSRYFARRKSFRLIPETDIEVTWNISKCDYRFQCLYSIDTLRRVYSNVGTHCSEEGIRCKRQMTAPNASL